MKSDAMVSIPPRGHLFQERILPTCDGAFWMLVACALVNKTTWEVAESAFEALKRDHPTPQRLARACPEALHDVLRPLGLWRQRAQRLPLLAKAWLTETPRTSGEILGLPSCGRYAADSWAIFVEGKRDVEPSDGKLGWYLQQVKNRETTMGHAVKKTQQSATEKGAKALKKQPGLKPSEKAETSKKPLTPCVPTFEALLYVDNEAQARREVARMPDVSDCTTTKDACCRLLVAVNGTVERGGKEWKVGFSFDSILRRVGELFPGTKTTEKCLRWYLVRIRQAERGWEKYVMLTRFERPKTRTHQQTK